MVVLLAMLVGILGLAGVAVVVDGRDTDDTADAAPAPPVELVADRDDTPTTTIADVVQEQDTVGSPATDDTDCSVTTMLRQGAEGDEVACLLDSLDEAGLLTTRPAAPVFDAATDAAVRTFQEVNALVVDGIVGPQTARELGIWSGPDVLPPDPATCEGDDRSVVVDRFNQRAWFCDDGSIIRQFPITTARSQPDPGEYSVYAKDLEASSILTGEYSTMTHFVAFTYGKYQGARIAFHSVPKYTDGAWVQPLDSVGDPERHGDSSGCIRVLPDDAVAIWDWLDVGGTVRVIT
jgi:peptidoglycan hydrolase-like protein with peptidoglycan-binding domain